MYLLYVLVLDDLIKLFIDYVTCIEVNKWNP